MSDITPIQGPLGPKDDAAKKDPKKIGTPEKFKETYRIQAIGETDAGPQKKRKRKEESEEDSLAEAISPLTPSSPKSLTASPYEVQPASKKISSVEGPQPAASAAPTSYSQSYATSSGPMATEESMTVSISSTPLSSTPSSSTSTPSAAPSSGSIPLSEDDYTLDTFSEDYFSFTPAPTYPQTQQTTSYPETYTYENTSSEEQTTPPSAQTNPAPVSAKKKIPLPLEKNANPLNSSTEAIPSSAEEAASGSPWTAKKKGSQDPKPSQVAIDQQTETSSPLQMQSSSPPITAPPKESSAEELGLSWEGDVQPSSALSSEGSNEEKKDKEGKKNVEEVSSSSQQGPVTPFSLETGSTQAAPPPYTTFSAAMLEMFDKMVGTITVLQESSGERKTSITLTSPNFSSSVFYGAEIVIEEDLHLAPGQYNIKLIGSPEAVALFQAKRDDLLAAFQSGNYNFRVQRIETSLQSTDKPLFKRKESVGDEASNDTGQGPKE